VEAAAGIQHGKWLEPIDGVAIAAMPPKKRSGTAASGIFKLPDLIAGSLSIRLRYSLFGGQQNG
jgi:hypothetical protein